MKRWPLATLLFALLLALSACTRQVANDRTLADVLVLDRAEAAPSGWDDATAPASGWVPVRLPDVWTTRWTTHDGVVWYRLRWNQSNTDMPTGLLLNYVCLADAVYLNGSLIHRDSRLVEPLARSWIKPQYFLIDRPLLREGENILLVRVSGLAAYQPGFGNVTVGDPGIVEAQYRDGERWRYDCELFNLAVGIVLGGLFGIFWLFRRQDAVYGWYALSALLFAAYGFNFIAAGTWPFASTDGWEAFNAALYLAAASSFGIFLLRYCNRRWVRLERALGVLSVLAFAYTLVWPAYAGPHRGVLIMTGGILYYSAIITFIVYAVRTRRLDQQVLAACLLIPVLTSGHDFLLFFDVIRGDTYMLALTSPLTLIGMGSVLAHRFANAMRQAENFNVELQREVDVATRHLSDTLAREHELALADTRIGERLNLVRDVHDGFGGSLLSAITTLEQSPASPETAHTVATLKELRNDLRLIIDTTTQGQDTDLAGLLVPLRHRWSERLELAGIESHWRVEGIEHLHLGPTRSLDLLRFLQEALTNVLKHSGAAVVRLVIRREGMRLRAEVCDDGHGFDQASQMSGVGLASLRARAARLGGVLDLDTAVDQGAMLSLDLPLQVG